MIKRVKCFDRSSKADRTIFNKSSMYDSLNMQVHQRYFQRYIRGILRTFHEYFMKCKVRAQCTFMPQNKVKWLLKWVWTVVRGMAFVKRSLTSQDQRWSLQSNDYRRPRSNQILMFVCLMRDTKQCCEPMTSQSSGTHSLLFVNHPFPEPLVKEEQNK